MSSADLLFAEHQRGVFRYLSKVVGQSETARDLTQEVFLRVSRTTVPDDDAEGRRAWVFRIARNLALNHLRDRGRQPAAVPLLDVATRPATQELKLLLDDALSRLPDLDRDVFLLRESVGLSYGEVAAACEVTVDAVRARLHRARQRLREELSGPLGEVKTVAVKHEVRGDDELRIDSGGNKRTDTP